MDLSKLHDAVFSITPLALQPENEHVRKAWEIVIGGMILPALAKEDPSILADNPVYAELVQRYTPEEVKKLLGNQVIIDRPVEVEKIIEKTVEVIKEVEKIVEVPKEVIVEKVVEKVITGSVKYRRLKDKIEKPKQAQNEITCGDRNVIITWWNTNQRLVPDDDPACIKLAQQLSLTTRPFFPAQVAGYFSHLCRLGMQSHDYRDKKIALYLKKGIITVVPMFSPALLDIIAKNHMVQRREEKARKADHEELKKRRAAGDKTPLGVVTQNPTVAVMTPIPVTQTPAPKYDIKFA